MHIGFPQTPPKYSSGLIKRPLLVSEGHLSVALQLHSAVARKSMSSGNGVVESNRTQALTVSVAAGAAVVILVLCSAVYSVLHYLF